MGAHDRQARPTPWWCRAGGARSMTLATRARYTASHAGLPACEHAVVALQVLAVVGPEEQHEHVGPLLGDDLGEALGPVEEVGAGQAGGDAVVVGDRGQVGAGRPGRGRCPARGPSSRRPRRCAADRALVGTRRAGSVVGGGLAPPGRRGGRRPGRRVDQGVDVVDGAVLAQGRRAPAPGGRGWRKSATRSTDSAAASATERGQPNGWRRARPTRASEPSSAATRNATTAAATTCSTRPCAGGRGRGAAGAGGGAPAGDVRPRGGVRGGSRPSSRRGGGSNERGGVGGRSIRSWK